MAMQRHRRGLPLSFYVHKEGQEFLAARSLPPGTLGHRDRSASSALRRAFGAFQWLLQEHTKDFADWPESDFVVLLRCLPSAPLFSGDRVSGVAKVMTIPQLVASEAARLRLEEVMGLGPQALPNLIARLRTLSPVALLALQDHLECLRVEYLKQS